MGMTKNVMRIMDADITTGTIQTLTVSSGLTVSATSAITINTLTVSSAIVFSLSTTSTSITFVTDITGLTTSSTKVTFTKQTGYLERGVIRNFSTVTTTHVISA